MTPLGFSNRETMKNIYRALVLSLVALSFADITASEQTVTLLHSFTFDTSKGKGHVSRLIADQQGALYGTTYKGGANGYGTIFKLTPPASSGAAWTETILYSFCSQPNCSDGSYPKGGLLEYQGKLYGTTGYGGHTCGHSGCGTIFMLTPPASDGAAWTYNVIHYFDPPPSGSDVVDGTNPLAGLILDQQGVLYGTTSGGGSCGGGTVFQLPLDAGHGWKETVLHAFGCGSDGSSPNSGVTFGKDGALYGTTYEGGANGYGTVFKLTPPASDGASWTETVVYSFTGGSDGAYPTAGLVADAEGALYGTTNYGGANCDSTDGCGTVFRMAPPDKNISTLHSFSYNNTDGQYPVGGVTFGQDGALYGTTEYGGVSPEGPTSPKPRCGLLYRCGTIFKLTGAGVNWTETVIYKFCPGDFCDTGAYPTAGLIAYQGALYGTTSYQGDGAACDCGTVFKLE